MTRISDALELLTAQHDEIDALLAIIVNQTDASAREQAFEQLADRITVHLAAEQSLFYPAIDGDVSAHVMQEVMAEHLEIKKVLADLLWMGLDDDRAPPKVTQLRGLLAGHAAWQESELFPTVAETRSLDELADLGARLRQWHGEIVSLAAAA